MGGAHCTPGTGAVVGGETSVANAPRLALQHLGIKKRSCRKREAGMKKKARVIL